MKVKLILSYFLFFAIEFSFSQDAFLSSGMNIETEEVHYSYSVGEPFVSYFEGNQLETIQIGVQQQQGSFVLEEEKETTTICLYPNPADLLVHLRLNGSNEVSSMDYSIFSIDGRLCKNGVLNYNSENEIFIQDLPVGEYTVYIEQLKQTIKFIKY